MDVQYNDKGVKEKLGSSVTGRPYDNLAYLPIKKRRPRVRSPSPPPETPLDGVCALPPHDSVSDPKPAASNSLVDLQRSQGSENALVKTNLPPTEESLGIELLASAAHENSNFDDVTIAEVGVNQEKLTPQETDASIRMSSLEKTTTDALVKTNLPCEDSFSAELVASDASKNNNVGDVRNAGIGVNQEKFSIPQETSDRMEMQSLEKSTAGIEGENPVPKVSTFGAQNDITDRIDSTALSLNLLDKTDNDAEKGSGSGKDVRLHWDLNFVMDDWELPADDRSIGSKGNGMENIASEGLHSDVSDKLHSSIGCDNSINALRLFNCKSDINGPAQLVNKLKHLASGSSSEGRISTSIQLGQTLLVKNVKLENQDDVLLDSGSVSGKSIHDTVRVKSEQEPNKLCEVSSVGNTVTKFAIQAEARNSSSKSEKAALPNVLSDNIIITPPVTTLAECQPVPDSIKKENDLPFPTKVSPLENSLSGVETKEPMPKSHELFGPPKIATVGNPSSDVVNKELISKSFEQFCPSKIDMVNRSSYIENKDPISMSREQFCPPKIATVVDHSLHVETKELMPKFCEHSGEVALEDPLDDGDVSDLSLGGHNHSVALVKEIKYPTGYESPFEDGEVREMDMNSSEENECERECLDYDIEDRDAYDYGMEEGSQSIQNEDNINFVEKATFESVNSLNESCISASVENLSGQDQIAMAVESNNMKTEETVISDSSRLDNKGSFTKEIWPRTMRANLSSRVGESPASVSINEKDNVRIQQRRSGPLFQVGQMFRGDKCLGRDRQFPQMQDERRKNNWNGSSSSFLDSRNHFQNKYQRGGIHPQTRSTVPDSETDDYHDRKQSTNYSAKSGYQPFVRKRPLDSSDNDFSTQRRNVESRDDGHGMIRGRSGNFHQGGFRGPRGDGPISNVPAPSSPYMPARRRRSSSPILSRNPSFSRACKRSRSRSRSRTRSPIPWRMNEDRNKGPRMEKTRIHYEDSKYEENDDVFCSPPRKRFSQGNSGSFNVRNSGPSRFRDKNSPGRFVGQRQRFDSRGSLERMKPDEGFRPRVHPQRFSKPSGEVWRGHNHDNNNNERTKYGERNEMIHRGRQSDNSGAVRRFHHNEEEDCFDGHNNRNNKGWDGRVPFKYDRERN